MRVALAQLASSTDPAENLGLVAEFAERARDAGAQLVVFPEATMASFATRSRDVAQPLGGPWASEVRRIASDLGVVIVVGMFTPAADDTVRNVLLVTGPGVEASYDKIHLFDALGFRESDHVEAGSQPTVVRIADAEVGLATCYDLRFPEIFTSYGHAGAHLILVPSSWANGPHKLDHWRTLAVARALDSTCFIVAAGQADPTSVGRSVRPGSPTGVGHSVVVDPFGLVLAEAGEGPELLVVDLDLARVDAVRRELPVLANARFSVAPPAVSG